MSIIVIVLIVLLVLVVAGLPQWPYAQPYAWGYYPSGVFGLALLLLALWFWYRF
jgi:hypothetical protein